MSDRFQASVLSVWWLTLHIELRPRPKRATEPGGLAPGADVRIEQFRIVREASPPPNPPPPKEQARRLFERALRGSCQVKTHTG